MMLQAFVSLLLHSVHLNFACACGTPQLSKVDGDEESDKRFGCGEIDLGVSFPL